METRTACIIRNKRTMQYIGRSRDQVTDKVNETKTMFGALKFNNVGEASEWMLNCTFAPQNTEQYEYVDTETEIREVSVDEPLSKDR